MCLLLAAKLTLYIILKENFIRNTVVGQLCLFDNIIKETKNTIVNKYNTIRKKIAKLESIERKNIYEKYNTDKTQNIIDTERNIRLKIIFERHNYKNTCLVEIDELMKRNEMQNIWFYECLTIHNKYINETYNTMIVNETVKLFNIVKTSNTMNKIYNCNSCLGIYSHICENHIDEYLNFLATISYDHAVNFFIQYVKSGKFHNNEQ